MSTVDRKSTLRKFDLQDWSFVILRISIGLLLWFFGMYAPESSVALRDNLQLFGVILVIYSVVMYAFIIWHPTSRGLTYMIMIPIDIAATTFLIQVTGGLLSNFTIIYLLLSVVYAAMYGLMPGLAFASIFSVIHLLANNEIIYHMATGRGILADMDPAMSMLHWSFPVFRVFVLFLITFAVGASSTRYRKIFARLQYANYKFESVNQMTESIRSSMKFEEVFLISIQKIHQDLEFERVFLYLVQQEGHRTLLRFKTGIGVPEVYLKEKTYVLGSGVSEVAKVGATGVISKVAETKRAINIADARQDFTCDQELVEKLNLNSFAAVPLRAGDRVLGVIIVDNYGDATPILNEDVESLSLFANQTAIALENARLHEETEKLAILDGLTNIHNHRYFQEFLAAEVERARRYNNSVSLLLADIDFFKNYNDSWGHPGGDEVLRNVARLFKESVRDIDLVARYGGEEFVVVLPHTGKQEAIMIAERIRTSIATEEFEHQAEQPGENLTVSIGLATYPENATTKQELITASDVEVYRAKEQGRNRVCYYNEAGEQAESADEQA